MSVKVSVIIPSLNVADYINECMDSVLNQSLYELEIICVDAGSTDGTRQILEAYARKDARVVILHSDVKSYGWQVNMGLEYAGGEYVAVLESDDWIAEDMYRCLYEHAKRGCLDYVAADFDSFYELQSGCDYYVRQRIFWAQEQEWYGKVLNSEQIATLRASDYTLWRGIYERNFLLHHHIRLHESLGAAFQDMGFLQQVKTYARRAMYIDKSFYRYRQGRGLASSGSMEGLRYYEREFHWLNHTEDFMSSLDEIHKKYYYFTMSISFITKYEQILTWLKGDWQDSRLHDSYAWFKTQIGKAIQEGFLEENMYGKEVWESMKFLLASPSEHAAYCIHKSREKDQPAQRFLKQIGNRPVVIFGCGRRGERLMFFCDRRDVPIVSFCDNNEAVHGGHKFGFSILSPNELKGIVNDKDAIVLLSMKDGTEQVYKQLTSLGIETDRILKEIPEGIL